MTYNEIYRQFAEAVKKLESLIPIDKFEETALKSFLKSREVISKKVEDAAEFARWVGTEEAYRIYVMSEYCARQNCWQQDGRYENPFNEVAVECFEHIKKLIPSQTYSSEPRGFGHL